MTALTVNIPPSTQMTDEQFFQLCQVNPDLRIERTASGNLIFMPPTGGETSKHNSTLNAQLWLWNQKTQRGEVFDSSGGFKLPNGADRSPDAAWVAAERWNRLSAEEKEKFPPICPDFVIELRSPSDVLAPLREKMQEYLANGTRLGWLINRKDRTIEISRSGQPVETLHAPSTLSGEDVLPGFVLDLRSIW